MLYGIIGALIVIIIILCIKLNVKVKIDKHETEEYQNLLLNVNRLRDQKEDLQKDIRAQNETIEEYNNKILEIQKRYREEFNKKNGDLDTYFEHQKVTRLSELETDFERLRREKEETLNSNYQALLKSFKDKEEAALESSEKIIASARESQKNIVADTMYQQERFEALLEPLRQYEKEQQERLFYTIQVPDEYKDDINFLIITVSQKVQHPDIINKLVWAEYVKPYIEQTFKRVGIEDKPGIYKITNLETGKCYIGKSTNIKKRLTDHFKSSIGIKTIADQAVHHEIWKTGFWNWTIEPIIYCDKEKLNELEKYYIDFFKSNIFGYNKTGGGEG